MPHIWLSRVPKLTIFTHRIHASCRLLRYNSQQTHDHLNEAGQAFRISSVGEIPFISFPFPGPLRHSAVIKPLAPRLSPSKTRRSFPQHCISPPASTPLLSTLLLTFTIGNHPFRPFHRAHWLWPTSSAAFYEIPLGDTNPCGLIDCNRLV